MIICKICNKQFPNNSFSSHLRRKHKLSLFDYEEKYGYVKYCDECGEVGYKQSPLWYSNKCKKCINRECKEKLNYYGYKDIGNFSKNNNIYEFLDKSPVCELCGKTSKTYKFHSLPLCKKCEKSNDYHISFEFKYNNIKGKESLATKLPDFFKISFWENNSNYSKEIIYNLFLYFRKYKEYFLSINDKNFDFIYSLANKIVLSNFNLKLEKYFHTFEIEKNKKDNFKYLEYKWFTERGFDYDDYIKHNRKVGKSFYDQIIEKYGKETGTIKLQKHKDKSKITLNNFILKYGEEEGSRRWKNYIEKQKYMSSFQRYIDEFGEEAYNRWIEIHKNKNFYSAISQKLFWELYEYLSDKNEIYFGEHQNEWFIYDKQTNNIFFVDFKYYNKVIEFNGDWYHRNPNKFSESEEVRLIWEKDRIKNNEIISKGFDLFIVWEHDFINNKNKVIEDCLDFLTK